MDKDEKRPIIIKRIKKGGHGHHGGAWKIAYADFVTAMMAFFLLMWLLNSMEKNKLRGIEEYFKTPLNMSKKGGQGAGEQIFVAGKGGGDQSSAKLGVARLSNDVNTKKNIERPAQPINDMNKKTDVEQEKQGMEQLKAKIEKDIKSNPKLKQNENQITIDVTNEGLRVQILDEKNRPMFDASSDSLQSYTKELLHQIGKTLNDVPNRISITGHTDATPYEDDSGKFSNWELSSDRANASRRELIAGGMDPNKVMRVVGLSSVNLLDKANPTNPINRRITIIVMNKQAETEVMDHGY